MSRVQLRAVAGAIIRDVRAEWRAVGMQVGNTNRAVAKVGRAARELEDVKIQKREMRAWKTEKIVRSLDCDLNGTALAEMVTRKGSTQVGAGKGTWRDLADKVYDRCTWEGNTIRLRIAYRHSRTGRMLLEAGHITGSREYAVGVDPFTWSTELRSAAFRGMGAELDDVAAYPRAMRAITGGLGPASERFLEHREEILAKYGEYLFEEASVKDRRAYMKGVTNAYDMDSGIDPWVARCKDA